MMDRNAINNFTVIEFCIWPLRGQPSLRPPGRAPDQDRLSAYPGRAREDSAIGGTLPENCVVIDAGANIGLVSIPLAQAIKPRGGVVHAFEAQRMMFYALCGSAALNDLNNLYVRNCAVGAAGEARKVPKVDYGVAQDFGMVSLVDQSLENSGETVPVCTIDGLGLAQLDFLKIDVEGMEIDVLAGARATIRRDQPWCWIEFWKIGIDPIKQQFDGLPYQFYQMDSLNLLCAPRARKEAAAITIKAPES